MLGDQQIETNSRIGVRIAIEIGCTALWAAYTAKNKVGQAKIWTYLINKIYLRYARNIYCIKYSNRTENTIFNFNKIGSIKYTRNIDSARIDNQME